MPTYRIYAEDEQDATGGYVASWSALMTADNDAEALAAFHALRANPLAEHRPKYLYRECPERPPKKGQRIQLWPKNETNVIDVFTRKPVALP